MLTSSAALKMCHVSTYLKTPTCAHMVNGIYLINDNHVIYILTLLQRAIGLDLHNSIRMQMHVHAYLHSISIIFHRSTLYMIIIIYQLVNYRKFTYISLFVLGRVRWCQAEKWALFRCVCMLDVHTIGIDVNMDCEEMYLKNHSIVLIIYKFFTFSLLIP